MKKTINIAKWKTANCGLFLLLGFFKLMKFAYYIYCYSVKNELKNKKIWINWIPQKQPDGKTKKIPITWTSNYAKSDELEYEIKDKQERLFDVRNSRYNSYERKQQSMNYFNEKY